MSYELQHCDCGSAHDWTLDDVEPIPFTDTELRKYHCTCCGQECDVVMDTQIDLGRIPV